MIKNNNYKYNKEQLEFIEALRKSAGRLTSVSGLNYVKEVNNLRRGSSK